MDQDQQNTQPEAAQQPQATQPFQTTPETQQGVPTPEPKSSKKWLIIGLVVSALLVGGTIAVLKFSSSDSEPADKVLNEANGSEPTNMQTRTIDEVVEQLDIKFLEQNPSFSKEDSKGRESIVALYSDGINHFVPVEGRSTWKSQYAHTAGDDSSLGTDEYNEKFATTKAGFASATSVLESFGFTESAGKMFDDREDELNGQAAKQLIRDIIVCEIRSFSNSLTIDCVDSSVLEDNASKIEPFYKAYVKKIPSDSDNAIPYLLVVGDITKNHKYPEIEIMSGSISYAGSGAAAIFYKVDGSEWVYSHGGHDAPECSEFSDDINAQKAFYDKSCYYENNKTTLVGEEFNT